MGLDLSGGTHLIWLPLDLPAHDVETMARRLSQDEHARAARFRFARDRHRYIVGRAWLRVVLGHALDLDPTIIRFGYGPQGKPTLDKEQAPSGVQFNMSHSQGMALLALQSHDEVGVDIEAVRPVPDAVDIARRLFTEEEGRILAAHPPDERDLTFARYWTRKEALLKSIGRGLSHPVNTFAVPEGELAGPVKVVLREGSTTYDRWLMPMPPPLSGYVAALAIGGGLRPVHQTPAPPL